MTLRKGEPQTTVYIAGTIHTPANKKATAAAGIHIGADGCLSTGRCIPNGDLQSQYAAELYAALDAIRHVDKNTVLTLVSAQKYVKDAINKKLQHWEHEGWAPTFFEVAAAGTPARALCKLAAMAAKRAARAPSQTEWDMTLPPGMALPGMSLQKNRQKYFYRAIREEKIKKLAPRPATVNKLEIVREAAYNVFDRRVTDAEIWASVEVKDILPRTGQFLWRNIHNAHRAGSWWKHIPECEDRAVCGNCGVLEDVEHILVECASPGQEIISLGTVLGCSLAEFRDEKGKIDRGAQRLYRILMSESAYAIWLLRNDRVIKRDGEPATEEEIINKWKFAINHKLQMDKLMANRQRRGKRPALAPKLLLLPNVPPKKKPGHRQWDISGPGCPYRLPLPIFPFQPRLKHDHALFRILQDGNVNRYHEVDYQIFAFSSPTNDTNGTL
ncbi:hypothetical protein B0H19DRAFT_1276679 [Mycena capillaripes]|nr:hypothetical protein B0H19DRAFT_1276679 [Mycena capillaripes]